MKEVKKMENEEIQTTFDENNEFIQACEEADNVEIIEVEEQDEV